ncbi:hypothetical protein CJO71_02750 [Burkholderia ubonensis]|nr:hypothetical protein CJO71_02750 [Burkholderia ubonensis]PAJ97014.1 hypothetical protein CJO68_32420 [Burkholderia ubonensis]
MLLRTLDADHASIRHQALCISGALLQYVLGTTTGKTFVQFDVDLKVIAANLLTEREFQFSKEATPDVPIALAARERIDPDRVRTRRGDRRDDGRRWHVRQHAGLRPDGRQRAARRDPPGVGDAPLPPGSYDLATLASRIIDLMLAACEATHVALDSLNGASIVHVPTGYADSFDRYMPVATRLRLYVDGYAATAATLPVVVEPSHQSAAVPFGAGA